MRKMTRQFLGLVLAMVMVISQFASAGVVSASEQSGEGSWVATQYFTNGDFETGDATGWSINFASWDNASCWPKVDSSAKNNTTNILNIWNGTVDGNALTISQTISAVPAGTYRVSFQQEGAVMTSGLSVSVGGVTSTLPATTGWDVWSTVTTDAFVLADVSDVIVTISGNVTAGYWGDLDNFVLEEYVVLEEEEPEVEKPEQPSETEEGYVVVLNTDKAEVYAGEYANLTAKVTYNGNEITDLEEAGLYLWFWDDVWSLDIDETEKLADSAFLYDENGKGHSMTATVTLSDAREYSIVAELQDESYTTITKAAVMVSAVANNENEEEKDEETVTYAVEVIADSAAVKAGETVSLTAKVTKNGETVTDLEADGLYLWWWTDTWNAHSDGNGDAVYSNYDNNSGYSLTADVTLPSVGTYYIVAELKDVTDTKILAETITFDVIEPNVFPVSDDNYTVVVTVDNLAPEAGDTVALTAKVTAADGTEITDLEEAGLKLWWWSDKWMTGHEDGLMDAEYTKDAEGYALTASVKLPSVGTHYIIGELEYNGTKLPVVIPMTTTEPEVDTSVSGEISVEKIKDLPEDFIMGMDISSVMSQFASGVTYKDFEGNTIDNITDFCKFLASNGITHIRVRVWNDPFDANGNGYGGGNSDVATAAAIAEGCRAAGLKMLIDFHCSDLWADPGKQQAPKAWAGYSVAEKATAVEEFIGGVLTTIDPECKTVDMVQVGNETTGSFIGVSNVADMCTLFSAGVKAVNAYNEDVKVVIHVTNPEKGNVTKWAANLNTYEVDYDVLATSYYPYWHGTLANLESQLKAVKDTYGKDVMVAETSYAYTLEDSDGHANTVRVGNNDNSKNALHPFSVQGQAASVRDVMATVNNAGGLGVFYWESAWITVGDTRGLSGAALDVQIAANQEKWETFGSGWASSYAAEYDAEDAGKWYGGSAVDNEAMFYPDGTPTAALYVWNYVKTGAVSKYTSVEEIANPEEKINSNAAYTLPETVTVTYNKGDVEESVVWNTEDVEKINTAIPGTYKVNGTVTFSKEVNSGAYVGQTTASVVYTLIVKQPNLITDAASAGFENGADYTIGGKGISSIPSPDDPYSGSGSMHWYWTTATTGTVTYNPVFTLEAGKYGAEIKTQGYAGDTVTLQVLNAADEVLFEGEVTVLEGWAVWKTATVNFELTEAADVKLRVSVAMQDGGWGTADELYLYRMVEEVTPDEKPEDNNQNNNSGNASNGSNNSNSSSDDANSENNDVVESVVTTPTTLVSSNASVEEIIEDIKEAETEATVEDATVEESDKVASETEGTELVILDEEVPLAVNAGGDIPMWPIFLATFVFLAFVGVYVVAKQRKMIK